jgi:tetratricopeptide (TPR) repeat protein
MIIGNGPMDQKLKYMAFEMGVGNQVLFIHEETHRYYLDLLCSLDFVLHMEPLSQHLQQHEKFPRYLLDAVSMQTVALVQSGSVAKGMLGENCLIYNDESEFSLCNGLQECLELSDAENNTAKSHSTNIIDLYSSAPIKTLINSILSEYVADTDVQSFADRFSNLNSEIELAKSRADYNQALFLIEDGLLNFDGQASYLSILLERKGQVLMTLNRADEAVEAFAKSIDYDAKNTSVYIALGLISFHGQAFKDAITFYKKAIGLDSDSVEAMVGLGMSYFRNSMHNESMYWLKKAVLKDGGDGKALTALIQSASDCPNPEMGVSALEGVLEATEETSRLLMALGRMYMKTGQSDKGHVMVQRALAAESDVA